MILPFCASFLYIVTSIVYVRFGTVYVRTYDFNVQSVNSPARKARNINKGAELVCYVRSRVIARESLS